MKFKKPNFWDNKKPSFLSYFLLPFTLPIILNNLFINKKKSKNNDIIKKICVGNIYVGGTGKTPLSIKLSQILKKSNLKTGVIKKFYKDQFDEQKLIRKYSNLYCCSSRVDSLSLAIKDNVEIAIFDDGLQDKSINYDLAFVCFNTDKWIGNGFLIPAGPLREKIKSIFKYDGIFLNGNSEDITKQKQLIRKHSSDIKIFETYYNPTNINKFSTESKYLIFSGIGNPDSFKNTLIKNKMNIIEEINFPDHYNYTSNDINNIKSKAKKIGAKILTTEKDFLRIDPMNCDGIDFLEININIKRENELIDFLKLKL